jgi:predicted dinucleotide-binding enzyme
MRIAILGAGHVGSTVGKLWSEAGHEVCFGTAHPEQHGDLVEALGGKASVGTPQQAVGYADVVLLAVPLKAVPELARSVGKALVGKVVLDAVNPYPDRDGEPAREAIEQGKGSSVWTAGQLRGARVVKAFNMQRYTTMQSEAHKMDDPLAIAIASDDDDALRIAADLVEDAGFEAFVVGPLERGKAFDPGTPHYTSGVRVSELRHQHPTSGAV